MLTQWRCHCSLFLPSKHVHKADLPGGIVIISGSGADSKRLRPLTLRKSFRFVFKRSDLYKKTLHVWTRKANNRLTLKPGENSILVKVCEETGGWGFYLRITDTDGNVFDDLKISRSTED